MSVILGNVYVHKYTGFTGRAFIRSQFLYGCVRVGLQSDELKEGKPQDTIYFDEVELIGQELDPVIESSKLLGTFDEDLLTGLKGTITCYTEYLSQSPRVTLTPKGIDSNGKPIETYSVDIPQLINVDKKNLIKEPLTAGPGKCASRMGFASRFN